MGGSNHPEIDRENTNPAIIQRLDSSPPAPSGSASQHFPESNYSLTGYEYDLPPEKIAQNPVTPRDHSRLLVVDSPTTYQHRIFRDLPDLLRPGDLLVLNNTRVIPARLYGHKANGSSAVEVLLLEEQAPQRWSALVRPGRRLKPGATIYFGGSWDAPELVAQVIETDPETSGRILEFTVPSGEPLDSVIDRLGQVPLPPYITDSQAAPDQYQTVYAQAAGAVAAPTAGLHFTDELLARLTSQGIDHVFITLHVGVGTFRPVEVQDITTHTMHSEWIDVPPETVEKIQQVKAKGGRVIAVGTTVTRALEGAAQTGQLMPLQGKTNLFIYPGYRWQVLDGLITNFHLPGSSLLMLVSALIGRERLLKLYQTAIEQDYRFYSFGDAMLILPGAARA
ncbi:tRNA preQ1(34) S-adenosylmethionine ribosyltransferase-isomerase QueA [Pseudanabaena sp. FACHB-2040]|uniref:tRNA preQ1(34) S-adenosylmethionine ribosyltransferase-isomerase QueA n=1 Tax=Pseudanabaena sp. FACHB-2040 TaxID=2692859 RepID=UPI001689CE00|nr:tRNA preQ1(34) S-adenosylmethionine ribosyltransferase-isomerase QueA [Pseudanabaena sp. FACHB-2040]MBD2259213.1 tRNA preQ1(34) S-adenosylmethionine ribosyltransferase-isomerase QueA [Pseudanabaena sp. FACHB-2040]